MSTTGFTATGSLSAALTIVAWVQRHGRQPTTLECKPSNGLMSFMTYYRRLPGSTFSAIISAAFDLTSNMQTSAMVSHTIRMRTCLGHGCEQQFPFQGAHIGFCPRCRQKRAGVEDEWYETNTVSMKKLRSFGIDLESMSDLMAT